jgi:hypothetical protein
MAKGSNMGFASRVGTSFVSAWQKTRNLYIKNMTDKFYNLINTETNKVIKGCFCDPQTISVLNYAYGLNHSLLRWKLA